MKRYLNICILTRVEKTGNLDDPYVEICEKLTVDGREIEIPEGCVAKVSYATYQKEQPLRGAQGPVSQNLTYCMF